MRTVHNLLLAGAFAGTFVGACAMGRAPGLPSCAVEAGPAELEIERTDPPKARPALATPPPPPVGSERHRRGGREARVNWDGSRLERLPGTVLLPDGSPACGARVIWSVGTPGYCMVPDHPIIAGATTDASGRFTIEQPEGGYVDSGGLHPRLHVSLPGFATQEIPAVAIPKQGDIGVRLLPEAWIRGCVVDQAGAPVVAVLVRFCDPSTRGAPAREAVPWFLTREAIASVYTQGDGRFEVRAVPAGRYDLEFLTFRGPGGLRGPRWLTTVLDADGNEPLEVRVKRTTRAKADESR